MEQQLPPSTPVWRILDAAANRTAEGLRVAEDYVRFALDDAYLMREWKSLRHDLTSLVGRLELQRRNSARSTLGDVGTQQTLPSETARGSLADVFAASVSRAQQAIRTLEEYSKLINSEDIAGGQIAGEFESLRYRSYTLAAAVVTTTASRDRLADAPFYVILDGQDSAEAFESLAETIYTSGAGIIQLRDKSLNDRDLLDRAQRLSSLARRLERLAIVNDRADIAVASGAQGVHVGQDELTVKDVRAVVGPDTLVGVSTHSIEQARKAVLDGANYIGAGPTFRSQTKSFSEFPGLDFLRQVAAEIRLPAYAIGGIKLDSLGKVLATGVTRVVASGAVVSSNKPANVVRQFCEMLQQATAETAT